MAQENTIVNNKSHQRSLRVRHEVDAWLEKRAKSNPTNRYRQIATEINAILEAAYEADSKRKDTGKWREATGK